MSELCRFDGISIRMYSGDHPPPHFHVEYSGIQSRFTLHEFHELDRRLPRRIVRKIRRWAQEHESELWRAWELASVRRNPGKISS